MAVPITQSYSISDDELALLLNQKWRPEEHPPIPDGQYTIYHIHSDLSNGVTNVDSVTKYQEYITRAKECGMTALGFSEHGSLFEWFHKKSDIEAAGMKYLHGIECYLTHTLDEKVRDNMHCVLIARNYDGFLELNRMVSRSFCRTDNHFYYVPRISLDELFASSNNIIVTTACIGGVFGKGDEKSQSRMLDFMVHHKDRCFLEIGHHLDEKQVAYNQKLYEISQKTGLRLIAGTDTHVLNEEHERGRKILQLAKGIRFEGEDYWDLKFHDYKELVSEYRKQNALPEPVFMAAIQNTNVLASMVEPFQIDTNTKYPHIYENPDKTFQEKIEEARAAHPYVNSRYTKEELDQRIAEELDVYRKTQSIDFMLLETYMREWEKEHGIECGYGRGSVSGSMIAYILGITQMDSMKFNLNFFRFMNPSRVTNADIDTDYSGKDRDRVKEFLLRDKMNLPQIKTSEIITFNTIALKGAIRDVGRALNIPLTEVASICNQCTHDGTDFKAPDDLRKKYKDLFHYVDIVNGTIVSIGTHPSGVLVSDLNIEETIGLCSVSTSDYPVSMINMKELDALMYVKLDILGLDNIGVINDTCKKLGIERLTPDNVDLEDEAVWKSIRDDTTLIFQWESNSAQAYLKKFMSDATIQVARQKIREFSYIKWLSFGNGLIRPACASFRDSVAKGEFYDNGFRELNDFLAMEAGRIAMQETIMQFLVKFCGYSNAESDNVRRAIAKKKGTEKLLPEIENRFITYSSKHYEISEEECAKVIKPFIQVILDASAYAFSWNHSDSYSLIGYICGYLRYYYPLEFLTSALNIFADNTEKTNAIIKYANKNGIKVTSPKFGLSKSKYFFTKEKNVIAKGLSAVKYMSTRISDELYDLSQKHTYRYFSDLLSDVYRETSINSRQLDILIKIDFFSDFGNQRELLAIVDVFELFKRGEAKQIKKDQIDGTSFEDIVKKYSNGKTKAGKESKSYTLLDTMEIIRECEKKLLSLNVSDLSLVLKIRNFIDIMGYSGYVSGKEEDRAKLYIKDVYPVRRKKDNVIFGYSILTQSVGSGKESRMTVFKKRFEQDPIHQTDLIVCKKWDRDGGYFRLLDYEHLVV